MVMVKQMIRLWGQTQYSIKNGNLSGFELFLREQDRVDGPWRVPEDFSQIKPELMACLLAETIKTLPEGLEFVSFNLDEIQFIDARYFDLLSEVQSKIGSHLIIELTERPGGKHEPVDIKRLVEAAARYRDSGLVVCLDDVGTGENVSALVTALDPYVHEYKYALQNVRGVLPIEQIAAEVKVWRTRADKLGKSFALEGFEAHDDLHLIKKYAPDFVQGYYFGKPHTLPIAADLGDDFAERFDNQADLI